MGSPRLGPVEQLLTLERTDNLDNGEILSDGELVPPYDNFARPRSRIDLLIKVTLAHEVEIDGMTCPNNKKGFLFFPSRFYPQGSVNPTKARHVSTPKMLTWDAEFWW